MKQQFFYCFKHLSCTRKKNVANESVVLNLPNLQGFEYGNKCPGSGSLLPPTAPGLPALTPRSPPTRRVPAVLAPDQDKLGSIPSPPSASQCRAAQIPSQSLKLPICNKRVSHWSLFESSK